MSTSRPRLSRARIAAGPTGRPTLLGSSLVVIALGVLWAAISTPGLAACLGNGASETPLRMAVGGQTVAVDPVAPLNFTINIALPVVGWLAIAGLSYAGATLAGSEGSLRRTAVAVAWCAVPLLAAYLLAVAVAAAVALVTDATVVGMFAAGTGLGVETTAPALFDGRGTVDLRNWLLLSGFVGSALVWSRVLPTVHAAVGRRGPTAVALLVSVLLVAAVVA